MGEEILFLKVLGEGFTIKFTATGDLESAKAAVSAAFGGAEVVGYEADVEMDLTTG